LPKFRLPLKFRDLLHAANLRHGADGFISPLKEGVLRIFFALKIRRLRPGLNSQTWVLKASTLPLDHQSTGYLEEITVLSKGPEFDSEVDTATSKNHCPSLRRWGARRPECESTIYVNGLPRRRACIKLPAGHPHASWPSCKVEIPRLLTSVS